MPPDSAWSNPFNKSEIKMSSAELDWKNFMNECLVGTEIFKKNECEYEKRFRTDPNLVMDMRHRMVTQSTKTISTSKELIHAEALKLLRIETHNKLLKQKEEKMVEKEIGKLKRVLENHRLLTKKTINETSSKKTKSLTNIQKFSIPPKLLKRPEYQSPYYETHNWECRSVHVTMGSKINQNPTPHASPKEEQPDEFSDSVSTRKGSIVDTKCPCKNQLWEMDEGKNEIMNKFFGREINKIKQDLEETKENLEKSETPNFSNQKIMENAWNTWKTYTQKLKNRKKEKTMYENKIETFLMKLKEKKMKEEKTQQFRSLVSLRKEMKAKSILKSRTQPKESATDVEERKNDLEKLMKEIKKSQTEACQKLEEIKRSSFGNPNDFVNVEFLKRMEERRLERLKRRQEIEDKKRKMEEEREEKEKEEEEEKKRQEKERKRKSLQELKEKRRLEKERKERQKEEIERQRLNMRLAENHYKYYVLRRYGFSPWKTLMKIRETLNEQALTFFENSLKKKVFRKWANEASEQMAMKVMRADAFYEKLLKRRWFFSWVLFHKEKIKQNQVAVDWNEFKIVERAFKRWLNFTQDEHLDYLNKKHEAKRYYERRLQIKYFTKLKHYPDFKKAELAKENRKNKWRQKVREILPDYRPADIIENP